MQHLYLRTYAPLPQSSTVSPPRVYDQYVLVAENSRTLTYSDIYPLLHLPTFYPDPGLEEFLTSPRFTSTILCSASILTPEVLLELVPELFL